MAHDRFAECHSFNVLGFIQLLYDTTCVNIDFWVKPVWGLGCYSLCPFLLSLVLNVKVLVGAFNQEKAQAFSVIVQFRQLIVCSSSRNIETCRVPQPGPNLN